jgi:hypothetical protein
MVNEWIGATEEDLATKSEQDMAAAVEALIEAGYAEDGHTRSETFRTGSAAAPIYGGIGGQISTSGGRMRFALPGSAARATVGKITIALYERSAEGKPVNMRTLPTRDTVALRVALGLPEARPGSVPEPR